MTANMAGALQGDLPWLEAQRGGHRVWVEGPEEALGRGGAGAGVSLTPRRLSRMSSAPSDRVDDFEALKVRSFGTAELVFPSFCTAAPVPSPALHSAAAGRANPNHRALAPARAPSRHRQAAALAGMPAKKRGSAVVLPGGGPAGGGPVVVDLKHMDRESRRQARRMLAAGCGRSGFERRWMELHPPAPSAL